MRRIVGCTVSAARWSGVCATSFWMFNRHGCGAMRISAATTSTKPDMQAKCSGLCGDAKKTSRKKKREKEIEISWVHTPLPGYFPLVFDRKNPKTPTKLFSPKTCLVLCMHVYMCTGSSHRDIPGKPLTAWLTCARSRLIVLSLWFMKVSPTQLVVKSNVPYFLSTLYSNKLTIDRRSKFYIPYLLVSCF